MSALTETLREGIAQTRYQTRYPWGLYFFLLVVIFFMDPFDFSHAGLVVSAGGPGLEEFVSAMRQGTTERQVGLVLLAVWGLLTLILWRQESPRVNGILSVLILFYISWAVMSILWSDNRDIAARRVGILLLLSIGALVVGLRLSLREIMVLTLLVTGFTLVTAAISEFSSGKFNPFSESWRFAGVMHPYGQARNCGLMAIASFTLYKLSARHRLGYLFLMALSLFFLVLTKSRIPFAGAVIGLSTCWVLLAEGSRKRVFLCLIGLAIATSLASVAFNKEMRRVTTYAASFGRGEEGKQSTTGLTGRTEIWETVLRQAVRRPLLGHGYNAFFTPYYLKRISEEVGYVPSNIHNGYIESFFSLGLIGLITFLAILLAALSVSLRLLTRNSEYAFVTAVLVWLCCILVFESITLSRPTFPTLLCMILFGKLAFVRTAV